MPDPADSPAHARHERVTCVHLRSCSVPAFADHEYDW